MNITTIIMSNGVRYFVFVIILLGYVSFAWAADPGDVVINEVAWMGTKVSYNDEWIELYNNADSPINLEGWILKAADGSPEIKLARSVLANGFYLLERKDDDAVGDISADLIYGNDGPSWALNNKGEVLELYDNFGNLIDSINASAGWLAGDNATKQTMERIDAASWGTSQNPGGTPKAKNSVGSLTPPPMPEPETEPQPEIAPAPIPEPEPELEVGVEQPISYPSGVVINEILPSPTGPDEEEEWIEIHNANSFEVNLSSWQISDTVGKIRIYTFPEETRVSPWGFLVLSRPATRIILNNSGDGLNLTQPDSKVVATIHYGKAPRGESFNRTEDEWVWSKTPTPGSVNIVSVPKEKPQPKASELAVIGSRQVLAATSGQLPLSSNSSLVVSGALALAIFSGTIILVLKRKIKTAV